MRPNLLNKIGVCSRIFKWLNQITQVAQSDYSSDSIRLLKWLNQITQVAQSASTAVCVTQFSHILNPAQPHQLINENTSRNFCMWFKYGLKAQKLLAQGSALGNVGNQQDALKGQKLYVLSGVLKLLPFLLYLHLEK